MSPPTDKRSEIREGYYWLSQDCPVCEKPPVKFVGRRGGSAHRSGLGVTCEIWRCDECGLVFPNPMPVPVGGLQQHYAVDTDVYFQQHETTRKKEGARHMIARAEQLIGGKGRLLDIGAGRGELVGAGRAEGWDVIGIEPSPTFAEHAARVTGAEIRHEPVERCNFASESFDVVVLSGVLEHLYNPDETVGEIARILRPRGLLYLDVPNEAGLYFMIGNLYLKLRGRDWTVNLAPTFEPFHVFGFTPRSLRKLLTKHKLSVLEWRFYEGQAMVPKRNSVIGTLEQIAARAITAASRFGEMGTYIETWTSRS